MNKILLIIIGAILIIHGLLSIYIGFKGGPLKGYISPSDSFIIRKIFGERKSNSLLNFLLGITELIFGILILIGKFF